jgi:hypothetical protein
MAGIKALIYTIIFLGFSSSLSAQDTLVLVHPDIIWHISPDTIHTPGMPDSVTYRGFKKFLKMILRPAKPPQKYKLYAFPVPVFSASPTVGFLYGIGAGGSIWLDDPNTTRVSTATIGAAYTIKKQVYINVKTSLYLDHDDWILYGDWRYLITSVPDFAPGTGPYSDQLASSGAKYNDNPYAKQDTNVHLLYYSYLRVYETAFRRVYDKFYMGLAYQLDYYTKTHDGETNLDASTPVTSNFYKYNALHGFDQSGSVLSGLSVNALYDSRDNQNNPYAGRYAFVSFLLSPTLLGSSKNSTMLWAEYRDYINIGGNHHNMLAFWLYGHFVTSGVVPFLDLPAAGDDQNGRGGEPYVNGRFKGEKYMFGEIEYRRHIFGFKNFPDLLGLAVFVNANTASSKENNIPLFKFVDPGVGGGLRFNISREARSNICVDYAIGYYGSQGVYVRFNEAF